VSGSRFQILAIVPPRSKPLLDQILNQIVHSNSSIEGMVQCKAALGQDFGNFTFTTQRRWLEFYFANVR
jgi:hypothetical protein